MNDFVPFACPEHGVILDTFPTATVWCHCGKKAVCDEVERKRAQTKRRVDRLRRRSAA